MVPSLVKLYEYSIERETTIFKKDDETDCEKYRSVSLLSVPSKIMESEINSNIVQHITVNNLVTERQWAYRRRYSTELLLSHLTEIWRKALDSGMIVAAAFVDFQKAFDCVSHSIQVKKLNRHFGITGSLFGWLKDYLNERHQFTVLNGTQFDLASVPTGIPQGSVLGPTLFTLFTNDFPSCIASGSLSMYAEDTTIYYIGDSADTAVAQLRH